MCELLCDFTVVCEHEDTGGVLVKTTYREHSCRASLEEVHDGLVCVRIACSGDKSLRLVHHDVYLCLALESLAVEPYVICSDIDLGSELCDYLSVDSNTPARMKLSASLLEHTPELAMNLLRRTTSLIGAITISLSECMSEST